MIKIYFDEIAVSGIDYPNNSQTTDEADPKGLVSFLYRVSEGSDRAWPAAAS